MPALASRVDLGAASGAIGSEIANVAKAAESFARTTACIFQLLLGVLGAIKTHGGKACYNDIGSKAQKAAMELGCNEYECECLIALLCAWQGVATAQQVTQTAPSVPQESKQGSGTEPGAKRTKR